VSEAALMLVYKHDVATSGKHWVAPCKFKAEKKHRVCFTSRSVIDSYQLYSSKNALIVFFHHLSFIVSYTVPEVY